MRALIVEDHPPIAALLKEALETQGLVVDVTDDGKQGWDFALSFPYDIIVLDRMLPELDGDQICGRLRDQGVQIPILMITAKDTLADKIRGLDLGADDYLVKPFEMGELLARVRALLRRGKQVTGNVLTAGELTLNLVTREVFRGDTPVLLGKKEFVLLAYLLRRLGTPVTKEDLLSHLWDSEATPDDYTVRTHINRLRNKIDPPGSPSLIKTLYGIGYRIDG